MGCGRVSGRPQGPAGQRGVWKRPRIIPAHPFLGSATDPDLNLGSLGALCSGEIAHPRAL